MVLQTCRCCCSTMRLEKASGIIGIIFTIIGALSVAPFAVKLFQMAAGRDQLLDVLTEMFPGQDAQELLERERTMAALRLGSAVLFTVFSALLMIGVYRGSRQLVLAFVVYFVIYLSVSTVAVLYAFHDPSVFIEEGTVNELRKQNSGMAAVVIYPALVCALLIYAFFWYLAAVVYSYYIEMATSDRTTEHRDLF